MHGTEERSRTMKLINADDLRQVLEVFSGKDSLGHTPVQLCDAMPTIDAVEVVQCDRCKHYEPYRKDIGFCGMSGMLYKPDWFCADGERKDGAE